MVMILSKEKREVKFYGHDVEATVLVVDSLLCPELDKYVTKNRKTELIIIELECEVSRFELMEV